MNGLFLGIDCGTQGLKCLVLDGGNGKILAKASKPYGTIQNLPPGFSEQDPLVWVEALKETVQSVLRLVDSKAIRALSVSGQQHGFVPLDEKGRVIRPAKLWNDTSTAKECEIVLERVGGKERFIELTGNGLPPGYTASKILWLARKEPENYSRLRHVLLPHDYLNYYLTGRVVMEHGDASGTALMDIRTGEWSKEILDTIDPDLVEKLPLLVEPGSLIGEILPKPSTDLGIPQGVMVAPGSGDNMMGAIGTGNVSPGRVTASLGTSGTVFAYSDLPIIDEEGEMAAFRDGTGGFLPLGCTMNVTVSTELVRKLLGLDLEGLERTAASAPPGAEGCLLLPYFSGERTPDMPNASGAFLGLRVGNTKQSNLARAAMEGATLGLNYVLQKMKNRGVKPKEIRIIGGGSKSGLWRKICAGVFGVPVVGTVEEEGPALGAAIQALWAWGGGEREDLPAIVEKYVQLDESTRVIPGDEEIRIYKELQERFDEATRLMRQVFPLVGASAFVL